MSIFMGVDDFYIDGKTYFNQQHFTHDGMICGFDEEKKTYSLFSYDQRWIYRVFETPMKSFGRAVRTEINRGYHGYVLAIKATGARVGLDMPLLNSNLKEYLHSDWARYPLDGEGDVYGTVVHDYLCLYLDRLANGDIPYEKMDHRLFRMIWEHKKGMLDRIRTVEERLGLSPDIGDGYAPLIAQADHMRMLYARYHRRRDDRLLGSIKTKLMEVKQREIVLLSHLTEAIDRAAAGTEVSA